MSRHLYRLHTFYVCICVFLRVDVYLSTYVHQSITLLKCERLLYNYMFLVEYDFCCVVISRIHVKTKWSSAPNMKFTLQVLVIYYELLVVSLGPLKILRENIWGTKYLYVTFGSQLLMLCILRFWCIMCVILEIYNTRASTIPHQLYLAS
jgi:hypothetical protein